MEAKRGDERLATRAARKASELAQTGLYADHKAILETIGPEYPDIEKLVGDALKRQLDETCAILKDTDANRT